MATEFKEIASRKYPEFDTYTGKATRAEFVFRNVSGLSFLSNWLIDTVVDKQTKLADATPLQAILKERRLELPYLPDIISEYELVIHYHDSPLVVMLTLAVAAALAAAGFLVMSVKSDPEDWSPSKTVASVAEAARYAAYATIAIVGFLVFRSMKGLIPSKN